MVVADEGACCSIMTSLAGWTRMATVVDDGFNSRYEYGGYSNGSYSMLDVIVVQVLSLQSLRWEAARLVVRRASFGG